MTGDGTNGAEGGRVALPGRVRLLSEFAILFLAVPVVQLVFFGTVGPFALPVTVFIAACLLLTATPGFRWHELVDCRGLARQVPLILGLFVLCAAVILGFVLVLTPDSLFGFPRRDPARFALVIVLYPVLSVLGQEITYRVLFFRRYGALFPDGRLMILASAAVFSLAHAFYQNWVAMTLTFLGGLVFAWAYARTRSFPLVWILHSLAGQVIFTAGLGAYFYHGAIPG